MNKTLYLCEKPSQARALAHVLGAATEDSGAYIGDGAIVTYGFGHMRNLADPETYIGHIKWDVAELPILPQDWKWQVKPKHQEQFDNIGRWLSKAQAVVIATDPDEEGEVMGRQLLVAHKYSGPVSRLWASALDPKSLDKALKNLLPLKATDHLYRAGMIRRMLDWMFGMNLSRAYTVQLGRTAHIGRIKTRLLKDIEEREREIETFVPTYFDEAAVFINGQVFQWEATSANAPAFVDQGVCTFSEEEEYNLAPPLPFTLSALLIHANQTAGIGLENGYKAAQALYEAAAISYPRTSSTALPGDSAGFAPHHAITTTRDECPGRLDDDARAIFNMVHLNGVLQSLGAARIQRQRMEFNFAGERFTKTAEQTTENEAGWLLCIPDRLDALTEASKVTFPVGWKVRAAPVVTTKQTTRPARFSEATLLQAMVAKNIGTEATRVDAITSLVRDKVSSLNGNEVTPLLAGRELIRHLPAGLSDDMNKLMRESVEQVQKDGGDGSAQILGAAKWLTRLIRGSPTLSPKPSG